MRLLVRCEWAGAGRRGERRREAAARRRERDPGAALMEWRLRLLARREIADRTLAVDFAKPPELSFTPGQFVDLSLIDPPESDDAGMSRTMTIASAPFEERLLFAMRLRDTAFKRVLRSLPLGSEVAIDEPAGAFTLHRDTGRAAVFLAGGIGVTPFRSMIRQAAHDGVARRLYLFYSNRRPEDAAFLDEFREMAAGNGEFKFVPTVTQAWRSGCEWQGETRYIAPELIVRQVGALQGPVYYLAGPPAMVQSLIQGLVEAGVRRDDIAADPFDGY